MTKKGAFNEAPFTFNADSIGTLGVFFLRMFSILINQFPL